MREARTAAQDEATVLGSRVFQQAQAQIGSLHAELERQRAALEAVQRDGDDLKCRQSLLQLQVL